MLAEGITVMRVAAKVLLTIVMVACATVTIAVKPTLETSLVVNGGSPKLSILTRFDAERRTRGGMQAKFTTHRQAAHEPSDSEGHVIQLYPQGMLAEGITVMRVAAKVLLTIVMVACATVTIAVKPTLFTRYIHPASG